MNNLTQFDSQNILATSLTKSDTIIFLNKSDVKALIVAELKTAYNFEWTGWRIPFYLDLNVDMEAGIKIQAEISCGGWLSNNSWQPNTIEVFKVERWELQYDLTDDMDLDEEIEFSIDDMLENCDWQNEIERNICEHLNHQYNAEYAIDVDWI